MKTWVIKKVVRAQTQQEALEQEKTAPIQGIWEDSNQIESETDRKGNVGYDLGRK